MLDCDIVIIVFEPQASYYVHFQTKTLKVDRGYRMYRPHFCTGVRHHPNECPGYDIKPYDGEAPALEIWEIQNTHLVSLIPGSLWPEVVAPDKFLSMRWID